MNAGDPVICIDANGSANLLRAGATYTVHAAGYPGHIYLDGIKPMVPGWDVRRFRRVPSTDISIFQAMTRECSLV